MLDVCITYLCFSKIFTCWFSKLKPVSSVVFSVDAAWSCFSKSIFSLANLSISLFSCALPVVSPWKRAFKCILLASTYYLSCLILFSSSAFLSSSWAWLCRLSLILAFSSVSLSSCYLNVLHSSVDLCFSSKRSENLFCSDSFSCFRSESYLFNLLLASYSLSLLSWIAHISWIKIFCLALNWAFSSQRLLCLSFSESYSWVIFAFILSISCWSS